MIAGWWQATRALGGNGLSWVYSVEWPLFALLAIWGWWHLVHEDPEAYRLRRLRTRDDDQSPALEVLDVSIDLTEDQTSIDAAAARSAKVLALFICSEFVLGLVTVGFIPFNRPSGWVPPRGEAIYLVHAIFGGLLVVAAIVVFLRSGACTRAVKLSGRLGFVGLLSAAAGGLLTEEGSLLRFLGMTLMLVGPMISVFAYMIPTLHMASRARASGGALSDVGDMHSITEFVDDSG